ncbi:sensor histidine kinase [Emticicia oligotrophica]|uniref:tetratricopeptide repeat-containing sensor histidine kinase n=1 Tax=Emticicia oligotrophica TaxID=312279 RepID=UPI00273B2EED|nr:sensor histidine kinase [Emticicia oligotrophica]
MKKFLLYLLLFYFNHDIVQAQVSNLSEIVESKQRLNELAKTQPSFVNDTLELFYLNKICKNYSLLTRVSADTGLYFTQKLYDKALSLKSNLYQLRALFLFSNFYIKKSLYTKALEANLSTLKKCEEGNIVCDDIWKINLRFGQIYYNIKEYEKTIEYLRKAIDYLAAKPNLSTDLQLQIAEAYRISGISAQLLGQKRVAKSMFLNVLKYCELSKNDVQIAFAQSVMGDYYLDVEQNANEAQKYLDEADRLFSNKGYWQGKASLYSSYVSLFKLKKDPTNAEKYAQLTLSNANESKNNTVKLQALIDLSDIGLMQNNPNKALSFYKEAIALRDSMQKSQKLNDLVEIQKRYDLEKMQIRYENEKLVQQKTTDFLQKQYEITKLKSEKLAQDFALETISRKLEKEHALATEQALKIETDKQKNEQERLSKQLKVNELSNKLKLENQQQKSLLIIVALISLLGFSAIIYSFILRKKNKELLTKNHEIQEALLKGQTIERKRVASELHDNVGSLLSAVRVSLLTLNSAKLPNRDQKVYLQIQEMVENACREVRLISHNLLPEELEKYGLEVALEKMIERLNFSTPIEFTLNTKGLKENHLDRKTAFHLYSICLELINNILKHSKATDAALTFRKNENILELFVRDNGKGLQNYMKGKGISSIEERVEAMKGVLEIESIIEEGTRTHISVPITQPAYAALQI